MPALRVAELETLFTANLDPIEKAETTVKETGKRIESKPIKQKVDADAKGALAAMDRVEEASKRIVTAKTMATVDANIDRAEKSFMKVYERIDYLKSVRANVDVEADIKRAEANLSKIQRSLDGLRSARATMEVDADTSGAEQALDGVADHAEDAGDDGGLRGGKAIMTGIVAGLATIPIVGAVAKIAETVSSAVADAFQDGLQIEKNQDRLQGLTGISDADVLRLGRAAGEAYANNFGESIEANMDTTRLALQFHIIDPEATTRDAQKAVQGLAGIADVLGEDVQPVARSVATMLSTGVAKSAEEAFDILATGAREGVNASEDLLDTFTEYPALFKRLGLSGPEALGLINQGLQAGARNSDLAADALKEFQIRATDGSTTSAAAFTALGLDAQDMTAKIARGGDDARAGLDQVLDGLRAIEDPVARNAAAVGLFGTQAEDLGDALFAMDLSTAVEQLDGVTGAAQRMFDTLSDNDASKMEQAQRNIEVAVQGIQGALATAFSDPLGDFADWVSQNRGPLMQFLLDLANGALDFGGAVVEAAADGTEAFGEFVAGPLADVLDGIAGVIDFFNGSEGRPKALDDLVAGMRDFDESTKITADGIRETVGGAIDDTRAKLNDWADPLVQQGFLNDAALRTADAISQIGDASGDLDSQTKDAVQSLFDQIDAARRAGESQEDLQSRYDTGRQAIIDQVAALTGEEDKAYDLVNAYGAIPGDVKTVVAADTSKAQLDVDRFVTNAQNRVILLSIGAQGQQVYSRDGGRTRYEARGDILEYMAAGGLTPMQPIAQMVPPKTWRVVGDRMDVTELYAPLDGSPRSWALLLEGLRRMPGVMPMADGAVVAPSASSGWAGRASQENHFHFPPGLDTMGFVRAAMFEMSEMQRRSGG